MTDALSIIIKMEKGGYILFWNFLSSLSWFITLVSLSSGIIIIILQVFFRYVLGFSLPWGEELARFCMIYIGMVGGALTARESFHPSIDFIKKLLTDRGNYILDLISEIVTILFSLVVIWGGYLIFSFEGFASKTPALRILWAYPYFSILLSGVLFLLFTLESIFKKIFKSKKKND